MVPAISGKKTWSASQSGWDITLSDFSPGMLEEAQKNLSGSDHPFTFQVVDAQAIPFADASFDIIIADLMLYHVPDRPRAFAEIRRALKTGGSFYAATFSTTIFATLEKLLAEADMESWLADLGFNLENGAQQLARWFPEIKLHRLENTLVVTEAEPLLAVVRSGTRHNQYSEATFERLRELIQQEINQRGVYAWIWKLGCLRLIRDIYDDNRMEMEASSMASHRRAGRGIELLVLADGFKSHLFTDIFLECSGGACPRRGRSHTAAAPSLTGRLKSRKVFCLTFYFVRSILLS